MSPSISELANGQVVNPGTELVLNREGATFLNKGTPKAYRFKPGDVVFTRSCFNPENPNPILVSDGIRRCGWVPSDRNTFQESSLVNHQVTSIRRERG